MAALNILSDGICYFDEEERIVFFNKTFAMLYAPVGEILRPGSTFIDIVRTGLDQGLWDLHGLTRDVWFSRVMASRNLPRSQSTFRFANGRWMMYRDHRTEDGGRIGICTDISDMKGREAELAKLGFMPILHRKNTDIAAFIGAHSLQDDETRAGRLVDPDAQANERLSANLPYLFPVSRFAHYLKAIARDKVGTYKERADMQKWLSEWINRYVLANTAMADDKAKAKRPLAKAEVQVDSVEGRPGYYNARFYLRPHYQLEGINASLRLVSELPSVKNA